MTGRARGPGTRARPRILAPGEQQMITEEEAMAGQESSSSGGAPGSGNSDALRGRGGIRTPLVTKPSSVETKIGTEGQDIKLFANYLRIKVPDDDIIFDYHVDFQPAIESVYERRRLIVQNCAGFDEAYIFDGGSNLKTYIDLDAPMALDGITSDGSCVMITFRHVGTFSYGCFEMLRLYNTQMRRNLQHLGLHTIGRYYYEPQAVKIMAEHYAVGIHKGYLTSVNIHDGGIMTVIDTIFKFVRRETVYCRLKQINDPTNPKWMEDARKEFAGLIVMTRFNNKTYRISDLDYSTKPTDPFVKKDGTITTFIEYYRMTYNIDIQDISQPLLVAVATERERRSGEYPPPVLLVPELCLMTGLTDEMRADKTFMRKAAAFTRLDPKTRMAQMHDFIGKIKSHPQIRHEMTRWRLGLENHLVPVKGRWMQKESVIMGNEVKSVVNQGDFTKEMKGKRLYRNVPVDRWAIVFPVRAENAADQFRAAMIKVGTAMGIDFAEPRPFKIENDRAQNYISVFRLIPPEAQMIVCFVSNDNKERYDAIKKFLCIEHPVPSQVITARVLVNKDRLMSVCSKIAIQIATKIGAEPWALDIPPKNIMVIGFDTYHDSSKKGRSVGGFVASLNQNLTQYYSKVHFHENREEMSSSIGMSTARAILVYKKENGHPPGRIIVYRDGVGEGMIRYVYEIEVNFIKKGILRANEGKPIPLTFIIVSKRINTRFFAVKDDKYLNPPCGTVVDRVVTRVTRYDFFLVSQSVIEGTVSPTMYDIVYDESGWLPTNQQKLAYKLCHLYFNWSGTVKVPAPCQYAHKLAFLCGQSLHKEPSSKLEKLLYFL